VSQSWCLLHRKMFGGSECFSGRGSRLAFSGGDFFPQSSLHYYLIIWGTVIGQESIPFRFCSKKLMLCYPMIWGSLKDYAMLASLINASPNALQLQFHFSALPLHLPTPEHIHNSQRNSPLVHNPQPTKSLSQLRRIQLHHPLLVRAQFRPHS
jgi:hypothetical protein